MASREIAQRVLYAPFHLQLQNHNRYDALTSQLRTCLVVSEQRDSGWASACPENRSHCAVLEVRRNAVKPLAETKLLRNSWLNPIITPRGSAVTS